jgi:hypothetical protein
VSEFRQLHDGWPIAVLRWRGCAQGPNSGVSVRIRLHSTGTLCVWGVFFALLFRRTLIVAVLMTPCTLMIVGVLALHGLALLRAAGTASSSESPCFDSLCAVCLCVRHIISDNRPNLCFGAHVGAVTLSVVCGT